MLAIVEHDQSLAMREERERGVERLFGTVSNGQRPLDSIEDEWGACHRSEFDAIDPIVEFVVQLLRQTVSDPRLADPPRSEDRQEPGLLNEVAEFGKVRLSPDEARPAGSQPTRGP